MGFTDKFKKVTERATELAGQAAGEIAEAAETAKSKTVELAQDNRERIGSAIDKAASTVSEHTSEKHQSKIDAVQAKAHDGLDRVAGADGTDGTDGADGTDGSDNSEGPETPESPKES